MKRYKYILEFLILGTVGALCHFVYEWTGENPIIGAFFSVNESTWEHLKLLFFPTVIYSAAEYLICKSRPENFICAAALSLYAGMLTIVVFYYTYTGILGFNVSVINILSFYLGLLVQLILKYRIIKSGKMCGYLGRNISFILIAVTALLFVIWSFFPPNIGLFYSPV